jgi:hypothetical protein
MRSTVSGSDLLYSSYVYCAHEQCTERTNTYVTRGTLFHTMGFFHVRMNYDFFFFYPPPVCKTAGGIGMDGVRRRRRVRVRVRRVRVRHS